MAYLEHSDGTIAVFDTTVCKNYSSASLAPQSIFFEWYFLDLDGRHVAIFVCSNGI